MAASLPIADQIDAASRMAMRCYTHMKLWLVTAGIEGRKRHGEVLEEYWEHLRFLQHGQLFTAIVELHSLLDAHKSTINLPDLIKAHEHMAGPQPDLRQALDDVRPSLAALRLLRNMVFAHRTKSKSYADVFEAAGITPNDLDELALTCVKVTNELRVANGLEAQAPSPLPVSSYERMLKELATIS